VGPPGILERWGLDHSDNPSGECAPDSIRNHQAEGEVDAFGHRLRGLGHRVLSVGLAAAGHRVARRLIAGAPPTKEMPPHSAFYDTRSTAGAVVHLHSCHSVALSMLPDVDPECFLPPLTPYGIMRLGRVKLLPFFLPGDPAMGAAVRGLAGKRTAVMLASHGPGVAGTDVEAAGNAVEELEDTARLALMTRGMAPRLLTEAEQRAIVSRFDVEWDT